ncbi:MAG: nicotinate phosphoribosyltransferase [Candidatus Bathyarchaeia archaeon]
MSFHVASAEEIKKAKTTDVYFARTKKILDAKGLSKLRVVAEVTSTNLPRNWPWAILCGVEETAKLFEGYPVDVYSMPEGSMFGGYDSRGVREPILWVEGPFGEFCTLETPMLGLLCQSTGIATMAARMRKLAGNRQLISFGVRRVHPAICPMVDRAAYIGGFDGVSSLKGAAFLGEEPVGTMPHALMVMFRNQAEAWKAFDEVIRKNIPRVALVDTYYDEKIEALMAAEALGKRLYAVRLDTHGTRRGDFPAIVREVRWELNLRGYNHVKIIASGGINDENIKPLTEAGVDGFGVGTSLTGAPTFDFAFDIVETEGNPSAAKRGKLSGKKQVWRCPHCLRDTVLPVKDRGIDCPVCHVKTEPMLKPLVVHGKIAGKLPSPREVRRYVLKQLEKLQLLDAC